MKTRLLLIVVGILLLLALACVGLGAVQAAPATPTQYETIALCPLNTDCFSVIGVYGTPDDLDQVMYWELWQYPPEVQDWMPLPDNRWIETRALAVAIWSPDGMFFEARLLGQLYRTWLPAAPAGW